MPTAKPPANAGKSASAALPPNTPRPSGSPPQGGPAADESTVVPYPRPEGKPREWGAPAKPEDWRKVRDLVGVHFRVERVSRAVLRPKSGPSAGKEEPSYICELDDGTLFSVRESSAMGKEFGSFGVPPTPGLYTVEIGPSQVEGGDSLMLRVAHAA